MRQMWLLRVGFGDSGCDRCESVWPGHPIDDQSSCLLESAHSACCSRAELAIVGTSRQERQRNEVTL
jgi:hypothetical protein